MINMIFGIKFIIIHLMDKLETPIFCLKITCPVAFKRSENWFGKLLKITPLEILITCEAD
jgi:hypothetical protein